MLLANDGVLDGRRIIPGGWVKAATTPPAKQFEPGQTGAGLFGYGYQTWLLGGKEAQFLFRGLRGQAIIVDPTARLVLVQTSAGVVAGTSGDLLALWFSAAKSLAK
jgi:CubicO group peptidase (beta-lactamase class C family)